MTAKSLHASATWCKALSGRERLSLIHGYQHARAPAPRPLEPVTPHIHQSGPWPSVQVQTKTFKANKRLRSQGLSKDTHLKQDAVFQAWEFYLCIKLYITALILTATDSVSPYLTSHFIGVLKRREIECGKIKVKAKNVISSIFSVRKND